MMSIRPLFIICSLVLWPQTTSRLVSRQIDRSDSVVLGLKLATLENESPVEELKVSKLSETDDELSSIQFSMFGKPYSFKLVPANSIFSSNFKIVQDEPQDGSNEEPLQESEPLEGSFYTDETGRGSFYIQQKNGQVQVDGFVDDAVVIRSSQGGHTATKTLKPKTKFDHTPTDNDRIRLLKLTSASKSRLQHDVATIEVLVFLDRIVHGRLVEQKADVKKYLGIFWNTVQNKYKVFTHPKVQLSLSGAVVLSDMAWITDTFLAPNKPDDEKIVQSFGQWLFKKDEDFTTYDVGVLHTGLDLSYKDHNSINTGTLGIAPMRGVCQADTDDKTIYSVCVVEDPYAPTYAGAMTAAHEFGHLLSANHDDPEKCDKHGLMAPQDELIAPSTMIFCNISIEEIQNELDSELASCLYDSHEPKVPIGPEAPVMTRAEICKEAYGDNFVAVPLGMYSRTTDPCVFVACFEDSNHSNAKFLMWVPEQTACGRKKVCIQGKCTTK